MQLYKNKKKSCVYLIQKDLLYSPSIFAGNDSHTRRFLMFSSHHVISVRCFRKIIFKRTFLTIGTWNVKRPSFSSRYVPFSSFIVFIKQSLLNSHSLKTSKNLFKRSELILSGLSGSVWKATSAKAMIDRFCCHHSEDCLNHYATMILAL